MKRFDRDPSISSAQPNKRTGRRTRILLAPAAALLLAAACSAGSGEDKADEAPVTTIAPTTTRPVESTTTTTEVPSKRHRSEMATPLMPVGGDFDVAEDVVFAVYSGADAEAIDEARQLVDSIANADIKSRAFTALEYGIAADAVLDVYSGPTPEDIHDAQAQANSITNPEIRSATITGINAATEADALLENYDGNTEKAAQFAAAQGIAASTYGDLRSQLASIYVEEFMPHTTQYHNEYNEAPA